MEKIAITTDTNSGITKEEADTIGIHMLPMPFTINDEEFYEGVSCTYEHFFEMLADGANVSTSQPAAGNLISFWDEILKTYDYIVHIPMSSALSSSYDTSAALSENYDGKVIVVDNHRISVSLRQSILDAIKLVNSGKSAKEIKKILEDQAYNCSIYLAVNTLELLKKSGRVTSAGAALATILNLKPVLQIQGGKLDAYAKARGMKNAEKIILEATENDLKNRFKGVPLYIETAYSGDIEPAKEWQKKVQDHFPEYKVGLHKLPISIACHVGAGVIATGCLPYIE